MIPFKKGFIDICVEQCFSTGVPRHTSLPWNFLRCAPKSFNILESVQKSSTIFIILQNDENILVSFRCAAKLFYKISVPQAQTG